MKEKKKEYSQCTENEMAEKIFHGERSKGLLKKRGLISGGKKTVKGPFHSGEEQEHEVRFGCPNAHPYKEILQTNFGNKNITPTKKKKPTKKKRKKKERHNTIIPTTENRGERNKRSNFDRKFFTMFVKNENQFEGKN